MWWEAITKRPAQSAVKAPAETQAACPPGEARRRGVRRWRNRMAAVLLGLLPFLVLEGLLRLCELPTLPPPVDPYVDLHNLQPLFQFDDNSSRYEISPQRMNLFRPASFAAIKPANSFRIFALGGSTTQGEPFSTETAFPEWMRLNLQAADEHRNVEVVNCGGLSYASYRVLAILREVLNHSPDLIVIYTGHNEYLEHRSYAAYREPTLFHRGLSWVGNWRTLQLAVTLLGKPGSQPLTVAERRTELATEVDALLDYQGGLADYRRGDAWYTPIPAHFRWNLERMVEACQTAAVPLLLVRPVSNLRDCPPFKFETDPGLTPAQSADFDRCWTAAKQTALHGDPRDAIACQAILQQALDIDPHHAGARFLMGQRQFDAGDFDLARRSFQQAKDDDVCPLRAPTPIADAVTNLARQRGVPLLDAEELFSDRSPHGLVGNEWLVDHVHPKLEGHQLLGEELAKICFAKEFFPPPQPDWQQRRKTLYQRHLSSLNEAYFQRGYQRLEGLQLWTQGRAKKMRLP